MPQPEGFPERLARARVAAGFSRRALGRIAQVSEAYISRLESGQRTASPVVCQALARALNVDAQWLVSGRGRTEPDNNSVTETGTDRLPAAIERLIEQQRMAPEVGRLPRPFLRRYLDRVDNLRAELASQWQVTMQDFARRIDRELEDFRARLLAEWRAERRRRKADSTDNC